MKGRVVYLTGAPASGKTTVARVLVEALNERAVATLWLDSDDLRRVLTPQPTYSTEERDLFYGSIAHLARLGAEGGVTVVVSATAHLRRYRDQVRAVVPRFFEAHLYCSPSLLLSRDPKGLYKMAAAGEIAQLPGIGVAYEPPEEPEISIDTGSTSPEEATRSLLACLDAAD